MMSARKAKPLMSPAEVSLFCQQAELLLTSGLPLHEGMPTLAQNYASTSYAEQMKAVGEEVSMSGSLYDGVKDSPLFPSYMREMVRIGETTGQLENVLHGLGRYYDREDGIRKAVRNAVTYPLVLIAMMAVVIAVLVARVLPIFSSIMSQLGSSVGDSAALLSLGSSIGTWALIIVGVLLAAVLALLLWRAVSPERADRVILRIFPPYAALRRKLTASRFAGVMQMMLGSGFPLEESIDLLDQLFDDPAMKEKLRAVKADMEQGVPFPEAVEKAGIFDPVYARMIRLGFDAGRADQVMGRLNEVYEADMDDQISRLVSMIEPTLVALLTVIIGAILLSVMLPLAGVLNTIA